MRKYRLILAVMCIVNAAQGQEASYLFSLQPTAGYEMNLLRSPSTYRNGANEGFGTNDLWKNAPFAGIKGLFYAHNKDKRQSVKVSAGYQYAFIQDTSGLKSNEANFNLTYKLNPHRKVKSEISGGFRHFIRTGENPDVLFGIPLSYNLLRLSNSTQIRLKKYWTFDLDPQIAFKTYQRPSFDKFYYLERQISTSLGYKYLLKRKTGYLVDMGFKQRNYSIGKTGGLDILDSEETAEEEIEDEEEVDDVDGEEGPNRIWRYYSTGIALKIPIGEQMKFLPRFGYMRRSDVIHEELGYNQFKIGASLEIRKKKWRINLNAEAYRRGYTDFIFETESEEEKLLVYTYVRHNLGVKYALNKQLQLQFNYSGKHRLSNANDVSRQSLRSYTIGNCSIGLIWSVKNDFKSKNNRVKTNEHK